MTSPQQPPATLAIHRGAARATISASPHLDRLAELRFIGRLPAVAVTSDTVRISYPWFGFPSLRARGANIALLAGRAWAVEIDGGAGELDAHLEATVGGGASRLSVTAESPRQARTA